MATDSLIEIQIGAPGSVLAVEVGSVSVDLPRSVGYFGGLAVAVSVGIIEAPLALFIAAVPIFKALTNSALPLPVRAVGEVLEGAAKPVGSDAEGVVQLEDQKSAEAKVIKLAPKDPSQSTGNNALRCILMDVLESQRDAMGKKRRGTVAA